MSSKLPHSASIAIVAGALTALPVVLAAQNVRLTDRAALSMFRLAQVEGLKFGPGVELGGGIIVPSQLRFALSIEAIYAVRSSHTDPLAIEGLPATGFRDFESIDYSFRSQAVEFPVWLRAVPIRSTNGSEVFLGVGAVAAFATSCRLESMVRIINTPQGEQVGHLRRDCGDDLRAFDPRGMITIGWAARIGQGRIRVDVRFQRGFVNVYDGRCSDYTIGGEPRCLDDLGFQGKSESLSFGLGVEIGTL